MARSLALNSASLLSVITEFIGGASPEELHKKFPKVSRPTLNRRLQDLVASGRIKPRGQGRARRYFAVVSPVAEESINLAGYVAPLSQAGENLRAYLRKPLTQRVPVGYQRRFLDNYTPNEDFYLPVALRQKLVQLGNTPGQRPAGTYAREILNRLLIDLSWASSRLEGNTYSLLDTRRLVEEGARAEGKSAEEATMILNHKRAIEFMVDSADTLGFSAMIVRNIHACLAEGLLADQNAVGALRTHAVAIEKSVYLPPQVPQLVEEMFAVLIAKAHAITDPFEQSFFAMVHLPYLQPFEDVNKRTSRLCANIPFIRENLCPLSFVDVTERDYVDGVMGIYERNDVAILRDVYEWAYERSSARYKAVRDSLGEPDPFKLKYRQVLTAIVQGAVIEGKPVKETVTSQGIPWHDEEQLVSIAHGELGRLNEGNFARFGIRPAQYAQWVETGRQVR